MPRYFFHLSDGTDEVDAQGNELEDDASALREAIRFGGSLLSDDPEMLIRDNGIRINVTGERGDLSCALIVQIVDANWQATAPDRESESAA
jgi:hypothetical protein